MAEVREIQRVLNKPSLKLKDMKHVHWLVHNGGVEAREENEN